MKRLEKFLPWLFGLLLATALFSMLRAFSYLRFENSDDILMVKSFMGFEGGVPATFNLYLHTLTARLLGWLSGLFAGVAWFSLLQLFFLWLSTAIVAKCMVQCALCQNASGAVGVALAIVFAGVCAAFACARVNFTTTAAMLGAAATAQLCAARLMRKRRFPRALLSVLLLLACYMIRPQTLLAVTPFWALALLWLTLAREPGEPALPRPFLAALLVGALCFAALVGIRAAEMRDPLLKELAAFQEANLGPMDYDDSTLLSVPDDVLTAIGWSRAELALVRQWYFMDENITAEAFEKLSAAMAPAPNLPRRVEDAANRLSSFYRGNTRYLSSAALLLLLCGLCFVLPGKGRRILAAPLAAALCALGALGMLAYLAYQGRFLARAADCALFPATALACVLAARGLGVRAHASRPRRAAAVFLCVLCLGAFAVHCVATKRVLADRPDVVSATREADLEAFALENGDRLILRTPDLLRDTRLFPDVSAGIPQNIMIWGDWYCRTPSWYGQLEAFGFDGRHFSAKDFLNQRLLFVTAQDAPPEELLAYIAQGVGRDVSAALYGRRGELRFFSFHCAPNA